MTLLAWKPAFDLGVDAMDKEHKELVAAMNRIHELDQLKAAKPQMDGAIQRLIKLTKQHFADEEAFMAKTNYADRVRHGMIHQDMLKRVGGYYEQFLAGDGRVAKEFFEFLVFWLGAHITGIDRKYAPAPKPQPAKA
jgi:hemerythrin